MKKKLLATVAVAAVVGLGAVGRAAVAEEIFRLGVGADPEVLDPADLRPLEPGEDMAGEVEHGVAVGLRAGKEPRVLRVDLKEPRDELRADLVALLANHGPERRMDAGAVDFGHVPPAPNSFPRSFGSDVMPNSSPSAATACR